MAPAQGAIPGILRFGTKNSNGWVERGILELGGGAWPPGFPSRPNLGLCFPWPCLLSVTPSLLIPPPLPGSLGASGEGGGAPGGAPNAALQGTALPASLSVSRSSSGAPALASGSEGVPCLFLCLSPTAGPSFSPPAVSVFLWPCSLSPSLLVWLGVGPSSICGSLSISDFRFPASGGGGAPLSPPLRLHPSLSLISPLARPPPSVSLSPVSGSQNLRFSKTLGLQPRQAPRPWGT